MHKKYLEAVLLSTRVWQSLYIRIVTNPSRIRLHS